MNTNQNLLFEFHTPLPKYKEQVISLNNINKWYRFQSSKIKNEYKELLKDWYIPTPDNTYEALYIEFHLYRHNKRTLDSDNLGFIIKWTIDAIKEINWKIDTTGKKPKTIKNPGWMIDDDNITYLVKPAILNTDLEETEIKVRVFKG